VTERRPWLTRNLVVLSGVSFLQDAASELVYPVLPIFLTVTLGAPAAVVGAIEGMAEGVAAVTKLVAGRVADRVRRRPLIGAGYGLAALGKVLVAVATVWPVVLAGRVVDRFGKGVRGTPRDALLVVGIPREARGRAIGFHRMADTMGAVVGPGLGLAVYELLDHHIRPLLLIAIAPAVLSVLLVAAVRENGPPVAARRVGTAKTAGETPSVGAPSAAAVEQLSPSFWRVVLVLTAFSLVNFPDALLLLRLHDIGFGLATIIGAYITYNAVYAALSYPAGALSDRWPRARVFGAGLLFFATAYVGLGATRDHAAAWVLLTVYGAFTAFTDGVGKAWISTLVPDGRQGSAQGVFQGAIGAAVLLAGVWAGLAWGGDGQVPLLVSGAIGAVIAAWLVVAPRSVAGRTTRYAGTP